MIIVESNKPELANVFIMNKFLSYQGEIYDLSKLNINEELADVIADYEKFGAATELRQSLLSNVLNSSVHLYQDVEENCIAHEERINMTFYETDEDYAKNMGSENPDIRALVAMNGKFLNTLVNDANSKVRLAAALYFRSLWLMHDFTDVLLDTLVTDADWRVRKEIASMNLQKYLDILRGDTNNLVLASVIENSDADFAALHAYSESVDVRCAVAMVLDEERLMATNLINDEQVEVRYNIAHRFLFNDHFQNDSDKSVRDAVSVDNTPF